MYIRIYKEIHKLKGPFISEGRSPCGFCDLTERHAECLMLMCLRLVMPTKLKKRKESESWERELNNHGKG